ncbi:CueP family metal-binding protein [Georgenia phoenicis]|uniref:CueP family metal-binding protein n=1 Tax=unclassified Georgenia TaxID=2626815 RepID=UPI002D783FB8|nr:CueP family metal-binding protein [Georgenia sp. H159]
MKRLAVAIGALVLVLAGCSTTDTPAEQAATGAQAEFLDAHGLAGMDVTEIIDHLDRLGGTDRPTDLMASIRPDELVFSDGQQELALDMPEDRFYLSVAPYVDQTHECFYHSLTTCQGELTGQDLDVRIVNDDGEVLLEEEMTTFDNGFVGLWLPRDVQGTVEVSYDGRTGATDFTTTDEGATCLTTLQLT